MKNIGNYKKTQSEIWEILTSSSRDNIWSVLSDIVILSIIIINTILIALNSFQSYSQNEIFQVCYYYVTIISIIIYSVYYILRLWSCSSSKKYSKPFLGKLKFITSPMSIIELIVICSVLFFGTQANLIFVLLIKTLKVSEYIGHADSYSPVLILKRTFVNKKEELFITILFSIGLMLLSSFFIFYFESAAQPDKFDNITPSIGWVFSVLTSISLVEFTPVTIIGKVFHVIMILLGILIVGLPVGILTGSFIEEIQESKKNETLRKRSSILIKAFMQEQKISLRKLVKSLDLASERKALDIDFAMSRLEFSQSEIFEASRFSSALRIRACKQNINSTYEDNLVLETFPVNTRFGCFINRGSQIHVISTQSVGDMAIGHFSRIVATALNANYYSNEFFTSANLLEEMQMNFAINELYNAEDADTFSEAFRDWNNILNDHIKADDIVIYLGTSSGERNPFYHVLCGGEKGDDDFATIVRPTFDDVKSVQNFYDSLSNKMEEFDLQITSHLEFGNTNKDHLTQVLRNKNKANVLTIYVSQKLLQFTPLDIYYKSIRILIDCINQNIVK